jgi:hypothetical protein
MRIAKDIIPTNLLFKNGVTIDEVTFPEEFLNELFLNPPPLTQCIIIAHLSTTRCKDRAALVPGNRLPSNIGNIVRVNCEKVKKFLDDYIQYFHRGKLNMIGVVFDNHNKSEYQMDLHLPKNRSNLLILMNECYNVWKASSNEVAGSQPNTMTTIYNNTFPMKFIETVSYGLSENAKNYLLCYLQSDNENKFKKCISPSVFNYAQIRNEICARFVEIEIEWREYISETNLVRMCYDGAGDTKLFKQHLVIMNPNNRNKFEHFLKALHKVWEVFTNPKKTNRNKPRRFETQTVVNNHNCEKLEDTSVPVAVSEKTPQPVFSLQIPRQQLIGELERLSQKVARNSDRSKLEAVIELLNDLRD